MSEIQLSPFYHSAVNAVTKPGKYTATSNYIVDRWMPLPGGNGTMIVMALRREGFLDRRKGEWADDVGLWSGLRRVADEASSSVVLKRNMFGAGMLRALMPFATHHIMPVSAGASGNPITQEAIKILEMYGIGPEHPANGVFLRYSSVGYGALHNVIRTGAYLDYVSRKIIAAGKDGNKEDVVDALQHIGNELQEGKHMW